MQTPTLVRNEAGRASVTVPTTAVTLTINGQRVQARAGQTILAAATEAGIFVPTLCHHPSLSAYGGCRVCVVEIERQRGLQPSCTFPVAEGLVVQTESQRVVEARKFVLQMLFSERQHYCMYCPASGGEHSSDCELQRLAYRYGLDCWQYAPDYAKRWPVDATRQHFVMDHARCILCRRCVRACAELAASHTLGVEHRGARTMVCADDGVPFAESSCVSCGTCLQICPTGALFDRRSAYLGHDADTQRTRSTCTGCAVGCGIETVSREARVIRVEGVWDSASGGVLCDAGRFEVLDDAPPRLTAPLVRCDDGVARQCSWDEALTHVAGRLARAKRVAGLVTARSTNQCLVSFVRMFHDIFRSDQVALLSGAVPPLGLGTPGTVADLRDQADGVIVIGGDPMRQQQVLGLLVRRAVDRGARLIVASGEETGLDSLADLCVRLQGEERPAGGVAEFHRIYHIRGDRLAQVKKEIESMSRPMVLYGPGLDDQMYAALRALPAKVKFLPLVEGANAVAAARLGLKVQPVSGDALYAVASDEDPGDRELPPAAFTVVQASYRNRWVERADVALPSKIWFEKTGHTTNLEGRRLPLTRSVDAPRDTLSDWATLFMLSVKMGQPLACITVTEPAVVA